MQKDFAAWHKLKLKLEARTDLPTFNEREIWWCSIGMNLGYEVYGKGEKFWRPVLILQKHNRETFFGLPLGSSIKSSRYYHAMTFNGRNGSVLLSQGRTFSAKRLSNLMGTLPEPKFKAVKLAYARLIG
jgi:mRNA interferase MazF